MVSRLDFSTPQWRLPQGQVGSHDKALLPLWHAVLLDYSHLHVHYASTRHLDHVGTT